jgi:hypothetical protein
MAKKSKPTKWVRITVTAAILINADELDVVKSEEHEGDTFTGFMDGNTDMKVEEIEEPSPGTTFQDWTHE